MNRDDGLILLHDSRESESHRAQGYIYGSSDATSVQYHPTTPDLFVAGNSREQVALRDARMAFGEGSKYGQGVVQTVSRSMLYANAWVDIAVDSTSLRCPKHPSAASAGLRLGVSLSTRRVSLGYRIGYWRLMSIWR